MAIPEDREKSTPQPKSRKSKWIPCADTRRKKGAVIAAAAADQLCVLINLSAYALINMGFQKIPLEKFLGFVAEYTEDLNSGKFDYKGCLEKVKDVLGYAIEDPDVVDRICEEYGLD